MPGWRGWCNRRYYLQEIEHCLNRARELPLPEHEEFKKRQRRLDLCLIRRSGLQRDSPKTSLHEGGSLLLIALGFYILHHTSVHMQGHTIMSLCGLSGDENPIQSHKNMTEKKTTENE